MFKMVNISMFFKLKLKLFIMTLVTMKMTIQSSVLVFALLDYLASLVAQTVKNPPEVQETWLHSLGWEVPLKKGVPTHSSFLSIDRGAWEATIYEVIELDSN